MKRKEKKVSIRYVKNQFNFIGLTLMLYTLFVLYLPLFITEYLYALPSDSPLKVFTQDNLLIGLLYIVVIFGTWIPFLILRLSGKIKLNEFLGKCTIKFKDFFVYTIVFLAGSLFAMFITSVLGNYLPIGSSIVTAIGVAIPQSLYFNPIFIILYTIAVPLMEEYAFRGVLLRSLGRYGNKFALVIVSVLYGLLHGSIASAIIAYFMSTMLVRITLKYRSIQPAIIMHIIFNSLLYVFEVIPTNYYMVTTVIILVIYALALGFAISGKFKNIRVRNKYKQSIIWKLFFTNVLILLSFVLVVIYSLIINLGL